MAQRVTLEDDLTGELLGDDGESVRFGLDGTDYVIDLGAESAEVFRGALAPYIAAGRLASPVTVKRKYVRKLKPEGETVVAPPSESSLVREWAAANGYEVNARGRLSKEIREKYAAAVNG